MRRNEARALIRTLTMLVMIASVTSRGIAAEWSAEPSLGIKGEYNSNLLLVSGSHDEVWGHWMSPGLKFAGSTENLEVSGKTAAEFVRYYGGRDQALTNLYFPLSVKYTMDRDAFSFNGGFTRDNTLMGELLLTGVVLRFTQRNLWDLAPSWSHSFTERWSGQAGFQYSKATYENGLSLGLVDYETNTGTVGVTYQLNEQDQMQVSGMYTTFETATADRLRSVIAGGQASATHSFTERLTGTVGGGPRIVTSKVDTAGGQLADTQTVWIAGASLRQQWQDGFAELSAARDIFPSGFGILLRTERLGLTLSQDLTERVTVSVGASVVLASSLTSKTAPFVLPENRYVNVTPRISWKISQWWSVDASYTYARRDIESFNDSAFQNAATVMLTYFPPKLSVGR